MSEPTVKTIEIFRYTGFDSKTEAEKFFEEREHEFNEIHRRLSRLFSWLIPFPYVFPYVRLLDSN